jgi:hypothetical protein
MASDNNFYLFLILYLAFLLNCCTYSISEKEAKFVPYKAGDRLIFKSTSGELDTIHVLKIDHYFGKKGQNNVSPFIANEGYIGVWVNHSTRSSKKSSVEKSNHYFLIMHKLGRDSLIVYFELEAKGAYSYYFDPISLRQIQSTKTEKMVILGHNYDDIIRIKHNRETIEAFQNERDFIKLIFWSKNLGYVRFDLGNGEKWFLKSIIRN